MVSQPVTGPREVLAFWQLPLVVVQWPPVYVHRLPIILCLWVIAQADESLLHACSHHTNTSWLVRQCNCCDVCSEWVVCYGCFRRGPGSMLRSGCEKLGIFKGFVVASSGMKLVQAHSVCTGLCTGRVLTLTLWMTNCFTCANVVEPSSRSLRTVGVSGGSVGRWVLCCNPLGRRRLSTGACCCETRHLERQTPVLAT